MRIITVTNQKGGCGKTTTAINLAASLAVNNRRVLLIDVDPQSHATLGLNIKSDMSMYNVLSKLTSRKAQLKDIIQPLGKNFDIAPSSMVLSTLEQELAGEIGRESRLWETLHNFNAGYDYIIIDCPPNLGILTINAIRAAGEIIVPVEASRFSFEGLGQLTSIIELIKDRLNHDVSFKVLIANFDSRLRHSFKMLDHIKVDFRNKLFSTIIHVNVKLKEAQNQGTHILNYDKYCRGSKDYFSLSREIIMQEQTPEKPMPQTKTERPMTGIEKKLEKKMKEVIKEHLPKLTEKVSSGEAEVSLAINAPTAKEVLVAGDFNGWKPSPMRQDNGTWKKRFSLPSGKYRYRFVIDGQWLEDTSNPAKELNPYGTMDSLLEV